MKWFVHLIFIFLYVLITFYGMGPVLIADGSNQERFITFLVILMIYGVFTVAYRFVIKKMR